MATIKTRLQYHESILNHEDSMSIIAKLEKMAVKFNLWDDVTAHIDPEGKLFYDVRVYVRTCKENEDGHYMYFYFQFAPSDKYFEVKSETWDDIINKYPPVDGNLYDTAMGKILDFASSIHPTAWTQINDFLVVIRSIAKQESTLYLKG